MVRSAIGELQAEAKAEQADQLDERLAAIEERLTWAENGLQRANAALGITH
jgi:uncharacterized protein involved in exopolysaccharide biosynthesis